jgi:hypothetical protein
MTFSQRVVSITQDTILPKVFDNILSDNFATFRFISNGKKWSGETLTRPVKLVKSTLGGSFSGLDAHSTDTVETRQTMSYDLRAYEMPVSIPGLDLLVNKTDAQVIDLMKTEIDSSGQDALDDIGSIFYTDGTGNGSKDFLGLDALNDDGTSVTTIGGLSRTTYSSLAGTRTASGGTLTLTKLAGVYTGVSGGSATKQKPTIVHSDETVWNLFESLLTPTVQANYQANGYPMVTRRSKAPVSGGELKGGQGFTSVIYKGVPWVADEKSTSQTVWFTNENYLDWYGARDPEMQQVNLGETHEGTYSEIPSNNTGLQFSGMMKPVNQYGKVGHIYLFGNLVTFQPRRQGRLTGVTTV